ncbi:DUF1543 domain-containing protein [Synechococcus sp. BS55D]|uniref:DUF1543 domain-containing protein n=1 Tax=Synechococcus sp. BS55D TaxID=2055943 RepID=UPI00103D6D7E|nr:DUF1543 domain-containing protein [Synechococcus sp. BS55D]TCD57173.1 DUF1543 domain-containing protein [Synechococcus sp. BS55D]
MSPSAVSLFLVVLGGRTPDCHVELHDVRWVVGPNIETTIPELRRQWWGSLKGLHIDSYTSIDSVDGYAVSLESNAAPALEGNTTNQRLWFINLGGYQRHSLQEWHHFGLVVATTAQAAKARARTLWLQDHVQVHKDDLHSLDTVGGIDDCLPIETISGWRIVLTPEPHRQNHDLRPEWFGYWRIDGRQPQSRPPAS